MILKKSKYLAELIGIILGDGNLGNYPKYKNGVNTGEVRCQYLRIYCNLNEKQYALELEKILIKVFHKKPYIYERKSAGELYLEISRKNLSKSLGLTVGDKIKNKIGIVQWITDNKTFLIACLRGLFDTDGCCYQTGKKYLVVNFKNHNPVLLENIYKACHKLGFNPYLKKSGFDVEIGRQIEIRNFFSIIRPRNKKHYRFRQGSQLGDGGRLKNVRYWFNSNPCHSFEILF